MAARMFLKRRVISVLLGTQASNFGVKILTHLKVRHYERNLSFWRSMLRHYKEVASLDAAELGCG
jgi:hypothetical protein